MQYPRSTLKKGSKVKSNHTKTFPANDWLFSFDLVGGVQGQTDHTNGFPANDFL